MAYRTGPVVAPSGRGLVWPRQRYGLGAESGSGSPDGGAGAGSDPSPGGDAGRVDRGSYDTSPADGFASDPGGASRGPGGGFGFDPSPSPSGYARVDTSAFDMGFGRTSGMTGQVPAGFAIDLPDTASTAAKVIMAAAERIPILGKIIQALRELARIVNQPSTSAQFSAQNATIQGLTGGGQGSMGIGGGGSGLDFIGSGGLLPPFIVATPGSGGAGTDTGAAVSATGVGFGDSTIPWFWVLAGGGVLLLVMSGGKKKRR